MIRVQGKEVKLYPVHPREISLPLMNTHRPEQRAR